MIIGRYKTLDMQKLQPLVDYTKTAAEATYHHSGTHQGIMLGNLNVWSKNNFWNDHQELYSYIEENVYPEHAPIDNTWFKFYTTEKKVGPTNRGEFIGLHQDREYTDPPNDKELIHTTSILIERSKDAIGGHSVLAGDSQFQGNKETRFKDSRDIMSRLVVENLTVPGESVVWNGWTMHGVSEMSQGSRLAFIVFKKTPFNEDYFKSG
jgi:hypothetical protein